MEQKQYSEDPGTSPHKKRNPQTRDYIAATMAAQGLDLGSGKTYERMRFVVKKAKVLREEGHPQIAQLLEAALDISKRGAYEIARMSEEMLHALCQIVSAGEAQNLIEARRLVVEAIRQDEDAYEHPISISLCKNGMYRIVSLRNKSSILASGEDLKDLLYLLQIFVPDLEARDREP